MTDQKGLAVQAVALKHLSDKVKEREYAVKTALAETLDPGDRKTATLDSGTKVGSISYTNGRASARIVDPTAFLNWVAANRPDEIVRSVRPSFEKYLLDQAKANGDAVTDAGELIPGVEVGQGQPYLSVRTDPAALPELIDAIRASGLLALDQGGEL